MVGNLLEFIFWLPQLGPFMERIRQALYSSQHRAAQSRLGHQPNEGSEPRDMDEGLKVWNSV